MNEIRVGELEDDFFLFFLKIQKKVSAERGDFGYNPEEGTCQSKTSGNPSDPISKKEGNSHKILLKDFSN